MLNEFLAIFCVSYVYSAILLLPVHLFYIAVASRRVPQPLVHHMHKWVLAITVCAPILFAAAMSTSKPTEPFAEHLDSYTPPGIEIPADTPMTKAGNVSNRQTGHLATIQNYHQMAWGVSHYLVGIVAVSALLGLIVFLARATAQRLYIRRLERCSRAGRFYRGSHLFTSDHIALPFSTGLVNRKIFLPSGLSSDDAEIILKHELGHFSKKHHYWSFLESIVVHLFWFNPVSHLIHHKGMLFREMECDILTIQTVDKYLYSRILLKTAISTLSSSRLGFMVQPWIQRKALKKRVENILNEKKRTRRLLSSGFFLLLAFSTGAFALISWLDDETLEKDLIEKVRAEYATVLENREGISFDQAPVPLVKVLIFNEDSRFYAHDGVDVRAVFRAMVSNLTRGKTLEGASTISQQLGRALYIHDRQPTLSRKLRTVRAARVIEKHFSKEQILEMYLNSVYFGQGAWGVETASRKFFDHPAFQLTIAESAMLVQSLSRPSDHNCIADPVRALARSRQLLHRMVAKQQADKGEVAQSLSEIESRFGVETPRMRSSEYSDLL